MFWKRKPITWMVNGKILDVHSLVKQAYEDAKIYAPDNPDDQETYRNIVLRQYGISTPMTKADQTKWAFICAVAFIVLYVALNVFIPKQTSEQHTAFRVLIALAAGGFGVFLPGIFKIDLSSVTYWGRFAIQATGGFAMFLLIYMIDPGKGNVYFERNAIEEKSGLKSEKNSSPDTLTVSP